MPTPTEELKNLLSKVETYLKQEKELFGDFLYAQSNMTPQRVSEPSPKQYMAVQDDLFGGSSTPAAKVKISRVAEGVPLPYPNEPWVSAKSIDELNAMICNCVKCPLGHTRTNFVFGVGNPHADIVMIGEAPGAEEDAQGEPFVGRAGQLLNKILEAIGLKREEVYICNILKCRPPDNRDPDPGEIEACTPHIWKQLELIKPKIILCLGRVSAQVLMGTNEPLAKLRGKVHNYRGMKLMVTYHPAALLRNPHWKRPTWEDMQKFRKIYDELRAQH